MTQIEEFALQRALWQAFPVPCSLVVFHELCLGKFVADGVTLGGSSFAIAFKVSSQCKSLTWLQRTRFIAIEDESNLLQAVTFRLRVVKECSQSKDGRHQYVNDVVLPADRVKSNGIDKRVEEDGTDRRDPSDGETS